MNRARDKRDMERLIAALGSTDSDEPTETRWELEKRRLLARVCAEEATARRWQALGQPPIRWVLGVAGLCGAAATVALVVVLWVSRLGTPTPLVLSGIYSAVADDAVMSGALVTVEAQRQAVLRLPDGTSITALGPTALHLDAGQSATVHLNEGRILAEVAPHPVPSRFAIITPLGEIAVHGTVFTVDAGSQRLAVRLYEGKVELIAEEQRLMLAPGQRAEAGPKGLIGLSKTSGLEQLADAVSFGRRDLGVFAIHAESPESETTMDSALSAPGSQALELAKQALGQKAYPETLELLSGIDRSAAAAYLRGRAHEALGQHREAAAAYTEIGELSPERESESRYLSANAWYDAGEPARAAALASLAAVSDSAVAPSALLLAIKAWYRAERWDEASAACDQYLTKYPTGSSVEAVLFRLAEAAGYGGEAERSREALELYLRTYPQGEHAPQAQELLGIERSISERRPGP